MFEGDYHGRIPGFRFLGEKLGIEILTYQA